MNSPIVRAYECMVGWLTVAVAFVVGSLDVFLVTVLIWGENEVKGFVAIYPFRGGGSVGCCYRMYSLYNFLTAHLCLDCGSCILCCFLFYEGKSLSNVDVTIVFIERYNVIK